MKGLESLQFMFMMMLSLGILMLVHKYVISLDEFGLIAIQTAVIATGIFFMLKAIENK